MTMCDEELLVGYLYDELSPAERRTMEEHLLSCAACRGEVKDLRRTRTMLTSWAAPDPALDLQVVRGADIAARRARSWTVSPAWGLAAAAILVLSVASAVSNIEINYGPEGVTLRTGIAQRPSSPAAAPVALPPALGAAGEGASLQREIQALGQRLQALEAGAVSQPAVAARPTGSPVANESIRVARQLIAESESRQQQELARRISQVLRDVEASRRVDLDRTQRALAEVQGLTDTTLIRQREMENHFLRVVQQPR
jgi:transcription initiation factor TFIIIB Brf1 subunit/transcription initiation factor TFIIB